MKRKSILCSIISVVMLMGTVLSVSAAEERTELLDSKEFIEEYYEAINVHDWEKVSEFYDSETEPIMKAFLTDSENQNDHAGLLNVEHVEAIEIVDVNFKDAEYLLINDYDGKTASAFIVGADYITYADSEYYADGVCYEVYALIYEPSGWKISEKRTVWDFDGLLEAGYTFGNQFYKTENVVNARRDGIILNYDGEYVGKTFEEIVFKDDASMVERASEVTSYSIPTEETNIIYYNKNSGVKYTKGFHTMCKAITYAECGSDGTFGDYPEARKACIMAIKTYVWHFYIIQESKDAAYHISSSQIAYNSNYKSTYGFLTDYSAVENVWMQGTSSAGKPIVFEANFKAGSETAQDSYWHKGDLKQLGCIYLLKNDSSISTYKDLLHYYYDSSNRSQGGAVQFFDADKKFI